MAEEVMDPEQTPGQEEHEHPRHPERRPGDPIPADENDERGKPEEPAEDEEAKAMEYRS